jgi:hypothetical protein
MTFSLLKGRTVLAAARYQSKIYRFEKCITALQIIIILDIQKT